MANCRQYHLKDSKVKIKDYLNEKRLIVEQSLKEWMLEADGPFVDHIKTMQYSLFAGGKRIRPILVLAAAEAIDSSPEIQKTVLPFACALECIHTYSLIHDDLPAMDNDDLRRGKPTNHKVFGEAAAILAGDGLLTWAFDLMSSANHSQLPAQTHLAIIQEVARAAGSLGMVGGQALDIANENANYPFEMLRTIHKHKTGALITCAVVTGGLGAGASEQQLASLRAYGSSIGLAFQIVDDLLNVTSTAEQLGKAVGSDADRGKATYPGYFGIEETREKALEAVDEAVLALSTFDEKASMLQIGRASCRERVS
jgi:geranylgeranyl diphosphate synthase type II